MAKNEHRSYTGADNGRAKLTEDLVREIRERYALGASVTALIDTYGLSRVAVENVVKYRSWRHVV
jgi:hypothetical protein